MSKTTQNNSNCSSPKDKKPSGKKNRRVIKQTKSENGVVITSTWE